MALNLMFLELVCFSVPEGSTVTFKGATYTAKNNPIGARQFQATMPGVVYGGGVEEEYEPGLYSFTHGPGQLTNWNALQASLQSLCDKMGAGTGSSSGGYLFSRGQTDKPPKAGFAGNPNDGALFKISANTEGILLGAVGYSENFTFYDTNELAPAPVDNWTAQIYNVTPGPYSAGQNISFSIRYLLEGVETDPEIFSHNWFLNDVFYNPGGSTFMGKNLVNATLTAAAVSIFRIAFIVYDLEGGEMAYEQSQTFTLSEPDPEPAQVCPIAAVAALSYLPLQFVRNFIEYKVFSLSSGERGGRKYFADVLLPTYPGSSTFAKFLTLEAHARPPFLQYNVLTNDYAYFNLETCLETQMAAKLPTFRQIDILPVQTHTMPFKIDWSVTPTGESGSAPASWVFNGGLSWEDFPAWKDTFFTEFLPATRKFLTWSPSKKTVNRTQQDYLYFLINFTPLPTVLKLKARLIFKNGQCMIVTAKTLATPSQYEVYVMPAGFSELGLETFETNVLKVSSYDVWLENGSNERLSEIRNYTLSTEYRRNLVEIMIANSLGGFDCLALTGSFEMGLEVDSETVERTQARTYQVNEPAKFKTALEGKRTLTANTGWLTVDEFDYVQEILLSNQVYLVDDRALVPLTLTTKKAAYNKKDDQLRGLKLEFEKGYTDRNYSGMPAYVAPIWTVLTEECQLDVNGNNTTYLEYHETNQYGGSRVRISENPNPGQCPYNVLTTVGMTIIDALPNKLAIFRNDGDGSASNFSPGPHQFLRTDIIFVCILYADQPQNVKVSALGNAGRVDLFNAQITARPDTNTGLAPGPGVSFTINFESQYSDYKIERL